MSYDTEVGRTEKTQHSAWFYQSREGIELIHEGLGQNWYNRMEACCQFVKASLTAWAGTQGREKIQHRLGSQTLEYRKQMKSF